MEESLGVRLQGLRSVDLEGKNGRSLILQSGKDNRPAADLEPPFCVTAIFPVVGGIARGCGRAAGLVICLVAGLEGALAAGGGEVGWTKGGVGPGRGI